MSRLSSDGLSKKVGSASKRGGNNGIVYRLVEHEYCRNSKTLAVVYERHAWRVRI
jgi:hypothetical protein